MRITVQPIIITSDRTAWSLRPMLHLIEKYWRGLERLTIGGYTRPDFGLPAWVRWRSIGNFNDYPVNKWSDGLIHFLHMIDDEIVLFLMDDYWLNRTVDDHAIVTLTHYMQQHGDIARLDLSSDRFGAAFWFEHGRVENTDLIRSDPATPYHFSYQAGLWRKSLLLDCLETGETPWQSEINGDARIKARRYLVLGTKQPPLRYTIASQHGHLALDGGYQGRDHAVPVEDARYILDQDWIPQGLIEKSTTEYV